MDTRDLFIYFNDAFYPVLVADTQKEQIVSVFTLLTEKHAPTLRSLKHTHNEIYGAEDKAVSLWRVLYGRLQSENDKNRYQYYFENFAYYCHKLANSVNNVEDFSDHLKELLDNHGLLMSKELKNQHHFAWYFIGSSYQLLEDTTFLSLPIEWRAELAADLFDDIFQNQDYHGYHDYDYQIQDELKEIVDKVKEAI